MSGTKEQARPRGRPKKADGQRYVPLTITLRPSDLRMLDEFVDVDTAGWESRSATIGTLIRGESRRRARRK